MSNLTIHQIHSFARHLLDNDLRRVETIIRLIAGKKWDPASAIDSRLIPRLDADLVRVHHPGGPVDRYQLQKLAYGLTTDFIDQVFAATHHYARTRSGDITPEQQVHLQSLESKIALTMVMPLPDVISKTAYNKLIKTLKNELTNLITAQVWQNLHPAQRFRRWNDWPGRPGSRRPL